MYSEDIVNGITMPNGFLEVRGMKEFPETQMDLHIHKVRLIFSCGSL